MACLWWMMKCYINTTFFLCHHPPPKYCKRNFLHVKPNHDCLHNPNTKYIFTPQESKEPRSAEERAEETIANLNYTLNSVESDMSLKLTEPIPRDLETLNKVFTQQQVHEWHYGRARGRVSMYDCGDSWLARYLVPCMLHCAYYTNHWHTVK